MSSPSLFPAPPFPFAPCGLPLPILSPLFSSPVPEATPFEFISHTTVAKRVDEYEFFHKAESGGTYISSGVRLALDLIKEKYPPEVWNIYPVYASDGDNWTEDNERAMKAVKELCSVSNMFGYAELLPSTYSTTMYYRFLKQINEENFIPVIVKEKKDLWEALKLMLSKELKEE